MGNVDTVLSYARAQVGKPYVWAASGPNSFDCSGLTMQAYAKVGVVLAHFTASQYAQLAHRPTSSALPGDLLFYRSGLDIYHVAIKSGDNSMIHAANSKLGVIESDIWTDDLMSSAGILPGNESGSDMPTETERGAPSGAPFTPEGAAALTRPLSGSDRAKMITWIVVQSGLGRVSNIDLGGLQNASDDDLVKTYGFVYASVSLKTAPMTNPVSDAVDATKSIANFLNKLSDPDVWLRATQVGAGAVIVGVALAAMLRTQAVKSVTGNLSSAMKASK